MKQLVHIASLALIFSLFSAALAQVPGSVREMRADFETAQREGTASTYSFEIPAAELEGATEAVTFVVVNFGSSIVMQTEQLPNLMVTVGGFDALDDPVTPVASIIGRIGRWIWERVGPMADVVAGACGFGPAAPTPSPTFPPTTINTTIVGDHNTFIINCPGTPPFVPPSQ